MPPLAAARLALLLSLALAAVPTVRAQAPDTLRLDAVLGALYADNPTLQAARLDARALARRGDQVGALPDPTASVMVAPYPILTARGTQRSQWRVEQMLPWPGTLGLRRDAADAAEKLRIAERAIRRAASKGVIPKRRASRSVGRLSKQLGRLQAG